SCSTYPSSQPAPSLLSELRETATTGTMKFAPAKIRFLGALTLTLVLSGCCTSKERQLQQVAKDWCLTIRASQVIPVYPLTEDLLPRDVFLASAEIQKEQAEFEKHGFLPLAQLIVRLHPEGVEDFYLSSH